MYSVHVPMSSNAGVPFPSRTEQAGGSVSVGGRVKGQGWSEGEVAMAVVAAYSHGIMTGGAARDDEDQRAKNVCTKDATAGTGSAGTVWRVGEGGRVDLRWCCGRPWMDVCAVGRSERCLSAVHARLEAIVLGDRRGNASGWPSSVQRGDGMQGRGVWREERERERVCV